MTISLFTPLVFESSYKWSPLPFREKALNQITQYFLVSQTTALYIDPPANPQKFFHRTCIFQSLEPSSSTVVTALKIVSYATMVIPLIALLIKFFLCISYRFFEVKKTSRLQAPKESQKDKPKRPSKRVQTHSSPHIHKKPPPYAPHIKKDAEKRPSQLPSTPLFEKRSTPEPIYTLPTKIKTSFHRDLPPSTQPKETLSSEDDTTQYKSEPIYSEISTLIPQQPLPDETPLIIHPRLPKDTPKTPSLSLPQESLYMDIKESIEKPAPIISKRKSIRDIRRQRTSMKAATLIELPLLPKPPIPPQIPGNIPDTKPSTPSSPVELLSGKKPHKKMKNPVKLLKKQIKKLKELSKTKPVEKLRPSPPNPIMIPLQPEPSSRAPSLPSTLPEKALSPITRVIVTPEAIGPSTTITPPVQPRQQPSKSIQKKEETTPLELPTPSSPVHPSVYKTEALQAALLQVSESISQHLPHPDIQPLLTTQAFFRFSLPQFPGIHFFTTKHAPTPLQERPSETFIISNNTIKNLYSESVALQKLLPKGQYPHIQPIQSKLVKVQMYGKNLYYFVQELLHISSYEDSFRLWQTQETALLPAIVELARLNAETGLTQINPDHFRPYYRKKDNAWVLVPVNINPNSRIATSQALEDLLGTLQFEQSMNTIIANAPKNWRESLTERMRRRLIEVANTTPKDVRSNTPSSTKIEKKLATISPAASTRSSSPNDSDHTDEAARMTTEKTFFI